MTKLQFKPIADPLAAAMERLAHWRRIALGVDTDLEADFAEWFGLKAGQARVLVTLYGLNGQSAQPARLAAMSRVAADSARAYCSVLGSALGKGCVARDRDGWFRLTDKGLSECKQAISQGLAVEPRREVAA